MFAQLSTWGPWGEPTPNSAHPIAVLRFAQTADMGFVPNAAMPNTFMATAVDLGAYEGGCGHNTYPSLCIHPGWKQEVGRRLHLGALDLAYNKTKAYWTGPIFKCAAHTGGARAANTSTATATSTSTATATVTVRFRSAGARGVMAKTPTGFELDMGGTGHWVPAPITGVDGSDAVVLGVPAGAYAQAGVGAGARAQVRYLWSGIPCTQHNATIGSCAVYAKAEGLPAPPFVGDVGTAPC